MIDEKGQILRLQKGAIRRTRHFLIVNDKYRGQNLAHLLPNPYFCSHHITKEPNKFRNSPSSPRTTPRQGSKIVAKMPRKRRAPRENDRFAHRFPLPPELRFLFLTSNMNIAQPFRKALRFYIDGFRQMTWGRTLWIIIAVKLFVMFAVLRLFFFRPVLQGTPTQKQNRVATELTQP